ncbi:MAG: hypothetical protein ABR519_02815 [Bacteroidales bacterium]
MKKTGEKNSRKKQQKETAEKSWIKKEGAFKKSNCIRDVNSGGEEKGEAKKGILSVSRRAKN